MSVPILGYVAIFVTILPFLAALFRIQYLDAEQRLHQPCIVIVESALNNSVLAKLLEFFEFLVSKWSAAV